MKEVKKHRHKWIHHDCNCPMCDYSGMEECTGCSKWRDDTGEILDW